MYSTEIILNKNLYDLNEDGKFYTYLHYTDDTDEIFYVGKGHGGRCCDKSGRNAWWTNIVNKHGYYVVIDKINMTEKEALAREVELVALYGRRQKGGKLVNLTDGGEGVSGKIYSKEERKRISDRIKSNLEYFQSFGERSKYFGKQLFGEDNPNYGNKGDKNPLSKKVVQLDLHGNFIKEFSSITEAGEATGISSTGISAVCTKRRNQIRGYVFRYKEDYDMNGSSVSLGPTNKKAVYQINKQTKEIIKEYPSTSSTKEDGFNPTNVGQVCRGEKKSHKGYIWKYKEEYDNSN